MIELYQLETIVFQVIEVLVTHSAQQEYRLIVTGGKKVLVNISGSKLNNFCKRNS